MDHFFPHTISAWTLPDMDPHNSPRVELYAQGDLRWVNSDETVTSQPARNGWQRLVDVSFMAFPAELY